MRIVVTGASGQLGAYLIDGLLARSHEVFAWSGSTSGVRSGIELRPVELTDAPAVEAALRDADAEVVIHAAALSSADAVFRDRRRGEAVNVLATRRLAGWAARHDRRLVYTSTDLVFDGSRSWYREDDPAHPILEYGRTKLAAESDVYSVPGGLVVRISLLYGPSRADKAGFFDRSMDLLRRGNPQTFFDDEFRTPLDYLAASDILIRLAESGARGLVHAGGPERLSRFDLMRRAAVALGIDPILVRPNRRSDVTLLEPRPADVSLDTTLLADLLPDLERRTVEAAVAALLH